MLRFGLVGTSAAVLMINLVYSVSLLVLTLLYRLARTRSAA
jgi:hypothetical protein